LGLFTDKYDLGLTTIAAYTSALKRPDLLIPLLFGFITLFLLIFPKLKKLKKTKIDFSILLPLLFFGILSLFLIRTCFYFAAIYGLFALRIIDNDESFWYNAKSKLFSKVLIVLALIAMSVNAYICYKHPYYNAWLGLGNSYTNATQEAEFIANNFMDDRYVIGNLYDHGGYLLWKLYPHKKIMIDPRFFPFVEWYREYMEFVNGDRIEEFLSKYPFNVIMLPSSKHVFLGRWFRNSLDWQPVFYGPTGIVYIKDSSGVDIPIVAGDFSNIREYANAANAGNFATEIGDVTTAEIILNVMRKRFRAAHQVEDIELLTDQKKAADFFNRGRFDEALLILAERRQDGTSKDMLSPYLLSKVGAKTIEFIIAEGNIVEALELADVIYTMDSMSLINLYNYAILSYVIEQETPGASGNRHWREQLDYIRVITFGYSKFDEAREQIRLALEGKKIPKPMVIVPRF
jgi:hypothetical protein